MTSAQATPAGNAPARAGSNRLKTNLWKPLIVFIVFSIAIAAMGNSIFRHFKESIARDKQSELAAIADLKIGQITSWIAERKGDAGSVANDPLFLTELDSWLRQGGPPDVRKTRLTERLASLQRSYASFGYTAVSLFDEKGVLRLSTAPDQDGTPGPDEGRVLESIRSGQIVFSDIHGEKGASGAYVEIDVVAPLLARKNQKERPIGAILLHMNPQRFLFPLIESWPTPSPTAESLLVRQNGDDVVVLNHLRHRKANELPIRLPLTPQSPAALAVAGYQGIQEGVDYRGEPVISVLNKIAGTPWYMVNKIDREEIYAPINQLTNWVLALTLCLIGAGGGIAVFWRQKEKKQYERELDHQRLATRLDYLTKYANDIILLHDSAGRIVDFNDRAVEAYGYSAEELSVVNLTALRAGEFTPPLAERRMEIDIAGALRFESMHLRKDGSAFSVESSVRQVDIGGEKYYQAIIRDISERKRAENELARQEQFIRQVIDSDPSLIFVKDAEGRFLLTNETMARTYGQTIVGMVGKSSADLLRNAEQAAALDRANREVIENRQERVAIEPRAFGDGTIHWFKTIRKPLVQGDGSVDVLVIATDITDLKEAEKEQQRLNRALRLLSSCNAALAHAENEAQLADVCRLIVETGGYRMAWVGYAEHDPEKTVRPVMQFGFEDGYLENAGISWADNRQGRGPTGAAIRTGVAQINQNFLTNPLLAPWRDAAIARGYQSSIALPLRDESKVLGALTIYSAEANAFNSAEAELLQELADNLAYGIITQRLRARHEQAEIALRSSEARFSTVFAASPVGIVISRLDNGEIIDVNPAFQEMFGFSRVAIVGRGTVELGMWLDAEDRRKVIATLRAQGIVRNLEVKFRRKTGETGDLLLSAELIELDGQQHLLGMVTDVTEQRLAHERESRLRYALDSTLDMIYIFRPDSLRFLYSNRGATESIGYSAEDLRYLTPPDIEPFLPEAEFRELIAPLVTGEKKVLRFETIHRSKARTDVPVEVQLQLVKEHNGDGVFVAVVRDITERKRAETELARQKAFMRQVIDADPNRIFVKDANGRFLLVNNSAAAALGLAPGEMVGKDLSEIKRFPAELAEYRETDRKVLKDGREIRWTVDYPVPSGGKGWLLVTKKRLSMPDGTSNVLGIAVDITQQKLSEMKLAESYRELQQLSLHLESVRADERAKIALNLHDEMGATLVAIKMGVAWLASKLPKGTPQLSAEATRIADLVSGGIRTMHQIVAELRPNLLGDVGLAAAAMDYVKKFRQHTGIECSLVFPEDELTLDADQSLTMFRILQESLNNVAKHAQAGSVKILFSQDTSSLSMVIKDNGIGFDSSMKKEKSFGLLGIRERALMVGGKARISSAPGKGTRVSVSIPCARHGASDVRETGAHRNRARRANVRS